MDLSLDSLNKLVPLITQYGTKVVGGVILIILAFFVSEWVKNIALKAMEKAKVEETLKKFASNMTKWGILLLAGISLLGILGIQTASFAAVIAAMGLAIGLAFQGTLSSLAAGVMLLIFRPFKVGQFIKVAGVAGTVDEIGIFTTSIDTADKRRFIMPNSAVFGATIENVSHHSIRRLDITVGTAYEADLNETRAVLESTIKDIEGIHQDPAMVIVMTELAASSIDWQIRVFCDASDYWSLREKILTEVKYALDRAGISIPYPKLDVNMEIPVPLSRATEKIMQPQHPN